MDEPVSRAEGRRLAMCFEAVIDSERSMYWDDFRAQGGKQHTRAACRASRKAGAPKHCVIHNPSNHRMRGWRMILRSSGLIERQCPHGVGHPDPDSAAYLDWASKGRGAFTVHGCDLQDGHPCCAEYDEPHKADAKDAEDICRHCGKPVYWASAGTERWLPTNECWEPEGFYRHCPRSK